MLVEFELSGDVIEAERAPRPAFWVVFDLIHTCYEARTQLRFVFRLTHQARLGAETRNGGALVYRAPGRVIKPMINDVVHTNVRINTDQSEKDGVRLLSAKEKEKC